MDAIRYVTGVSSLVHFGQRIPAVPDETIDELRQCFESDEPMAVENQFRPGSPGFRTRQVILVTTLLDSAKYPPQTLSQLYFRRWAMELTLRNIKITLQMDQLSCRNPENLEREIRMHFLCT